MQDFFRKAAYLIRSVPVGGAAAPELSLRMNRYTQLELSTSRELLSAEIWKAYPRAPMCTCSTRFLYGAALLTTNEQNERRCAEQLRPQTDLLWTEHQHFCLEAENDESAGEHTCWFNPAERLKRCFRGDGLSPSAFRTIDSRHPTLQKD